MNTRFYALEIDFLNQLLSDRKEIMEIARSLGTADEMRAAREDLLSSVSCINVTPKTEEDLKKSYTVDSDGVATIPIIGQLTPHAKTDACGGYTADALTEYGFIARASGAADKDESVKSIEYFIDSPGGYVSGLASAVQAIRLVSKPTSARVGGMAASAAYWLASQTDKIIATDRLSRFGSIGVAVEEYDDSKKLENAGITKRVYTSTEAPGKRPDSKTEEGRAQIISSLDEIHSVFVQNVAEGRGVTVEEINKSYGRGSVMIAEKALKAGMIDSIETVPSRREESLSDVIGHNTAAAAESKTEEVKRMDITLETLKKDHSGVFAEAVAIGEESGVKKERARRNALKEQAAVSPENADLQAIVNEAIENGTAQNDFALQNKITMAIQTGAKLDGENAPSVRTVVAEPVALSDEDKEAAKLAGVSFAEYAELMKEAE